MMRVLLALLAAIFLAASSASAEVTWVPSEDAVRVTLCRGGVWTPCTVASGGDTAVLNPAGDLLGDSPPAIALDPITHEWVAFWSRPLASGSEIWSARCSGKGWEPAVLTAFLDHRVNHPAATFDCEFGNRFVALLAGAKPAEVFSAR